MPWGSRRLLPNTGTSKGAFHRLSEGMLLDYFELTDCNTRLCSPCETGSLATALCSSAQGWTDGHWVRPCMGTGLCHSTAPAPQLLFYWDKHLGVRWEERSGGEQRILPQLRPINISYGWNKNDYIPASTFLVYFKCVTAFYFLPRLCFL